MCIHPRAREHTAQPSAARAGHACTHAVSPGAYLLVSVCLAMAFAAPRRWRKPEPRQLTDDAWVPHDADFSAADAAAILDMERSLHHLRVAELNPQARFGHQKPLKTTGTFGAAPHQPWDLCPSVAPPLVRRHRQKPEWNSSIHTRSRSVASQAAGANVADRLRKESFMLLRTYDHQRDHAHRLSRPKTNRDARHTRVPRRQRRWSDPQIKISTLMINDAHRRTLDIQRKQSRAEARIAAQANRFRQWEQHAGEGRGMAGREPVDDWRAIRSKSERLRALADATGAAAALEHGLHGAFGGYQHHCLNDAEAMHMLREKLARERTRALELEAQLWEERQREWELEKAIEFSLHSAYTNAWGIPMSSRDTLW